MGLILLIEDNMDIRENTAELLELEGYNVQTALNGLQALVILEEKIPDIILCDISMPELNGYDLLKQLKVRDEHKSIPFVFITASAEKKEIEEGIKMGAQAYITKPYEADELVAIIKTYINSEE